MTAHNFYMLAAFVAIVGVVGGVAVFLLAANPLALGMIAMAIAVAVVLALLGATQGRRKRS